MIIDQVVLILNTGGGTVTGYGLAAAQLVRLKETALKLTISVEQVPCRGAVKSGRSVRARAQRVLLNRFAVRC